MSFNPLFQLLKLALWIGIVETRLILLQKQRKVLGRNAVEFPHVALGLVPKIFKSIDVVC